eukprot:gene9299-12529_t
MNYAKKGMKAAVATTHKGAIKVMNVEIPVPKAGELLVKIKASGVCHTDVHAVEGDWPVKSKMPLTPGHEGAGIVHAVGPNCKNFKVGDRVGIAWLHKACGNCEYCNSGWETLCDSQANAGYSVDGGWREYAIASDSHAIPIPDSVSFEQAAPILCAGVTSYKGLKETETLPGQFVTIVGAAGGLGHLAVQYAKAMGMRVLAVDVGATKLNYCKTIGAEAGFDASDPEAATAAINEYTGGGSHGVLCLATNAGAFNMATNVCRKRGCVVCVGLPAGTFPTPIVSVVVKRVTIRGSIVGTRQDAKEAFDFAARGLVKCTVATDKIENIQSIFDKLKANQIEGRIVLKMDD